MKRRGGWVTIFCLSKPLRLTSLKFEQEAELLLVEKTCLKNLPLFLIFHINEKLKYFSIQIFR